MHQMVEKIQLQKNLASLGDVARKPEESSRYFNFKTINANFGYVQHLRHIISKSRNNAGL